MGRTCVAWVLGGVLLAAGLHTFDAWADAVAPRSAVSHDVEMVSPAQGAVVWGRVGLSAQRLVEPAAWDEDRGPAAVRLRLPDGTVYEPLTWTGANDGPRRVYGFEFDADVLPPGPAVLCVEALDTRGDVTSTARRRVFVHRPDPAAVRSGEAESLVETVRSPRYQNDRVPKRAESAEASGGAYIANTSSNPLLTLDLKVERAGWYQFMVRARGTPCASVLPVVGVRVGDDNSPRTSSQLPGAAWGRMPVGRPIHFEPGEHKAAFCFENDQNFGKNQDRNLHLDTFEVCRLPDELGERAGRWDTLRVAMTSLPHGRVFDGDVTVRGSSSGSEGVERVGTELLVNGQTAGRQYARNFSFTLPRASLRPGENTLQLRATDTTGNVALSAEHIVTLAPPPGSNAASGEAAQVSVLSRTVFAAEPGVTTTDNASITLDGKRSGEPVAVMTSNGHTRFPLDEALAGRFALSIDARGDSFDGDPVAKVTLIQGDQRTELADVEVKGGYRDFAVKGIDLDAGPKSVEVAFTNDAYDAASKKDRNLFVRGITLDVERPKDSTKPHGAVRYPEVGQNVRGVDAVVIDVGDDRRVRWAQAMIDGEAVGGRIANEDGLRRMLLPLVLRQVEPGVRELSVEVADAAGNRTTLEPREVRVLPAEPRPGVAGAGAPAADPRYERAVRLLDRFAYGPEPMFLADVLVEGEDAWLDRMLGMSPDDPAWRDAWAAANIRRPDDNNNGALTHRAAHFLLNTANPVQARLVMFNDNHFNTWLRKVQARRKAPGFARWVELGSESFTQMLRASATSPAMLVYLDQQNSAAGRINENYAREVMELHTLGVHGGYTQEDVTQLAQILTGWTVSSVAPPGGRAGYMVDQWTFHPPRHDFETRTVLGHAYPGATKQERAVGYRHIFEVLDRLAAHPATARFVSGKLADHYVGFTPSRSAERDALIEQLAGVFTETDGNLCRVVGAIARSEAYRKADPRPRLTHPVPFAVKLLRLTGRSRDDYRVTDFARRSGFGIFDRESPDGYPERDEAYANTNAMLQRWKFAREIEAPLARLLPEALRDPPKDATDEQRAAWLGTAVDELAARLTGRLLCDRSHDAVMKVLMGSGGIKPEESIRLAAALIAQMPEMSLR